MSEHFNLDLINEHASTELAIHCSSYLKPPLILALSGDLGAGKTTLVRAMLRHFGVHSAIKSPTFSLVESYVCHGITIHHFDLYRIHNEEELEYLGFRDYFSDDTICIIEWAEHAGQFLPHVDIRFNLSIKGAGRHMQIQAFSPAGHVILDHIRKRY